MTALTAEELMAWVERTAAGWRSLIDEHPEMLAIPCDVRETTSVAGLMQHIVAVELRYAQRLHEVPESPYEDVGMGSGAELFATHQRAMAMMRELFRHDAGWWESEIDFVTRRGGVLRASRRVILVHALMHSIRHYAQLATLARQHGIAPDWPMDYLFMGAREK